MNSYVRIAAICAGAVMLARPAGAQNRMRDHMPPGLEWRVFHDAHRNVDAVRRTIDGLGVLQHGPKTRLSKPQSKAILAVLKAWRHKPVMTDAQARVVNSRLTAGLTNDQRAKMAASPGIYDRLPGGPGGFGGPPPNGRPPMPPPGQFGGHGGPPQFGPGGPGKPKEYNPLNPDTAPFPPMRDRLSRQLSDLMRSLGQ